MTNNIQIFKNDQFGEIRTAGTPEKPLFCLVDICKAMELSTVKKVKNRLRKDGVTSIHLTDSLGRTQDATFINEQNLYLLIMRSDKPQAEPFQNWVCGEVLPAIRKTGGYLGAENLSDDEIMAKALVVAQKTIERKAMENHVVMTDRILSKVRFSPKYSQARLFAATHHELLNGRGYPSGLKAKALPLESRILTVVDVFDALTCTDRPYKKPIPRPKAFEILRGMAKDGQIEARLVDYLENALADVEIEDVERMAREENWGSEIFH